MPAPVREPKSQVDQRWLSGRAATGGATWAIPPGVAILDAMNQAVSRLHPYEGAEGVDGAAA